MPVLSGLAGVCQQLGSRFADQDQFELSGIVSPPVEARILGMRFPVRHLDIGLEDNARFLAKLHEMRKPASE